MLSCDEFLAEFGDYLNDEASLELRTLLEEHLRECKTCRVVVDSTRKTVRVITDTLEAVLLVGLAKFANFVSFGLGPVPDFPPKLALTL